MIKSRKQLRHASYVWRTRRSPKRAVDPQLVVIPACCLSLHVTWLQQTGEEEAG